MADSDQAIRDIVAQLQGSPTDAQVAAATPPQQGPVGVMPAPEVTPAMTWGLPQSAPAAPAAPSSEPMNIVPAGASAVPPGPPMVITPTLPAAPTKGDDWIAPVPTMTPPAVAAVPAAPVMGRIAGVQPQMVPTMGALMVRQPAVRGQ